MEPKSNNGFENNSLPNEGPGQYVTGNYGGLVERVDTSHGPQHLNTEIQGAKGSFSRRALGEQHYRTL
jgi:hypothetical protein